MPVNATVDAHNGKVTLTLPVGCDGAAYLATMSPDEAREIAHALVQRADTAQGLAPNGLHELPVFELFDPATHIGLRIWANGSYRGRQPPDGTLCAMVNRIPHMTRDAYLRGRDGLWLDRDDPPAQCNASSANV